MTVVPVERPLAAAVQTVLEATLGAGLVGYGVKPAGGGATSTGFTGYAVIYPGITGPTTGPASAGEFDADQSWQVTSVGITAEQADIVRDRCRLGLLTTRLAVTGRSAGPTELADSLGTRRDDDVTPPLYTAVDRFTVRTTPA